MATGALASVAIILRKYIGMCLHTIAGCYIL
jgi:hypothetical protein